MSYTISLFAKYDVACMISYRMYNLISWICNHISYMISYVTYTSIPCQVKEKEKELKHKLRPDNAFLKAKDLNLPAACPREELHQFLIGLYGEHVLPASLYAYTQVLRAPALYNSPDSPLVTEAMLRRVWTRLRDRLSSLDASSTMVEVTPAYATHFIDMYVDKHTGKHMTGDRVRILLLSLPFLLRDLIAPEVCIHTMMFMHDENIHI